MASPSNAGDSDHTGANTASTLTVAEPKRKVSILTEPTSGHDNPAFEGETRSRKTSQISSQSDGGIAIKSILQNPKEHQNTDNAPITQQPYVPPSMNQLFVDNKVNGERKMRKHSTTESLYDRHSRKHSTTESLYDRQARRRSQVSTGEKDRDRQNLEQSWIYNLCMRCNGQNEGASWQPPGWSRVCPYPLCPTYRHFARLISIVMIGILVYITVYAIIGKSAAPGGQLFSLVTLTIGANFGGFLMGLTTLPRLIGMLFTGILFQNIGWVDIDGDFKYVTAELRKFALVIILTRAGLEMDPEAFKKIWFTILKLSLIPWTAECIVNAVAAHYLLGLPWIWGFLLGSVIAAVSPAVVVPCLLRLRVKGYGVAKGIPTLIIAVAGIADAASVAVFGILVSIMFTNGSLAYQISQAPICILGGLGFGVLWGNLSRVIPEKGDAYAVPIRTLLLFGGGLLAVFGSELIGFEGAGPLGVVFAAFTSSYYWCKQGWSAEDNPVQTAFEIFWMIFEPILFGITGATVKINELDPDIVGIGVGCILIGVVARIFLTAGIAFGDQLNVKEKFFVALSWMAKATVQAALGPVALRHVHDDPEQKKYAEIVLMLCVLCIVITAPTGAILISVSGTKLLTKTKKRLSIPETGWRRSARPSMHDISIIEEEEDRDDPEMKPDVRTLANTHSNSHLNVPTPTFTITK